MAAPFGPDFLKNLDAELSNLSRSGYEEAPPPKPQPKKLLRGRPGSPERLQQVAEMTSDDPSLIAELGWAQVGTELQNALHQIRADESREEFYDSELPAYRPETVEAFASATRILASVGDPQLYAAFANELGEDSPIAEYLPSAVEFAGTKGRIEDYGLAKAAEEKRMSEREQTLNREYRDIERRTGPVGVEAADQLAQNLNEQGLLYHPQANDDLLRAEMRVTAEQVKANARGLRTGAFLAEFDKEAARKYGPGSSYTDAERAEWERQLREGTVETVQRPFGDPADAADRAIDGMIEDDARHATGKSAFQRALEAELDEHDSHARQNSPHLKALADANVREFEATHDESGYPLTTQDGLGREHGGRR